MVYNGSRVGLSIIELNKGVELVCPLLVFDRGVDFLGFESFCLKKA